MRSKIDYAFASGGLLSKILRRIGMDGEQVKHKFLWIVLLVLLCWLPLLALSFYQFGFRNFYLLFVRDVATHVRFLIALPLLLIARQTVNRNFNNMVETVYETEIVNEENDEKFQKILRWVLKWKKAVIIDILLVLTVYITLYIRENEMETAAIAYAPWLKKDDAASLAGWWYIIFSLPVLQLIFYRWLYTIVLWIIFLFKMSRIHLNLSSLHPDGVGGLGFLRYTQLSYFPVALAFSSIAAAGLNNMMIFADASINEFKVLIISVLVFTLLIFVIPLLIFIPILSIVKKRYYMYYSHRAWLCARDYEKMLNDYNEDRENKPDASWHIDSIGSFEKTADMKPILIDKTILIAFVSAVVIPFLPVFAQEFPLKELFLSLLSKFLG